MKSSDCVKSIGWNRLAKCINVEFHSGAVWAYPAKTWEYALMHRVNSPGKFYNRHLKGRDGGTKVLGSYKERAGGWVLLDPVPPLVAHYSALFNQTVGLT